MHEQLAVTEETTHTPRPWKVRPGRTLEGGVVVDFSREDWDWAIVYTRGPRQQSNAALIEAAPKLLAALRNLYEAERGGWPNGYQMEAAKAVLAKLE